MVDRIDLKAINFKLAVPDPHADINADSTVDVNDIAYVLYRLGNIC